MLHHLNFLYFSNTEFTSLCATSLTKQSKTFFGRSTELGSRPFLQSDSLSLGAYVHKLAGLIVGRSLLMSSMRKCPMFFTFTLFVFL